MDFSETKSTVSITFYKPKNDTKKYLVELNKNILSLFGDDVLINKIELYDLVKMISVNNDNYKLNILFNKIEIKTWQTINGPKNKDNLIKTDYKEEVSEDKDTNSLYGLLENIYFNGDQETKMAMLKSFQESQGTILKTNFEDEKLNE